MSKIPFDTSPLFAVLTYFVFSPDTQFGSVGNKTGFAWEELYYHYRKTFSQKPDTFISDDEVVNHPSPLNPLMSPLSSVTSTVSSPVVQATKSLMKQGPSHQKKTSLPLPSDSSSLQQVAPVVIQNAAPAKTRAFSRSKAKIATKKSPKKSSRPYNQL
ncbi:hypothetical protein BDZ94DRAFT_1315687 [Collybia nuda]|uniref:Uncharacterized protein n=1 Tax=Collybia nuda TaxID=64659 RepID=A0A9P6C873_9AGAR|nr:hypothetical protein BDZ94DRAFT_1315687 [Collybia nuda]